MRSRLSTSFKCGEEVGGREGGREGGGGGGATGGAWGKRGESKVEESRSLHEHMWMTWMSNTRLMT